MGSGDCFDYDRGEGCPTLEGRIADVSDMGRKMASNLRNVSHSLVNWCRDAGPAERRTIVLRLMVSADLKNLTKVLEKYGDHVESAGGGVVTAVVSVGGLQALSRLNEVLAVDEPRDLYQFEKLGESSA